MYMKTKSISPITPAAHVILLQRAVASSYCVLQNVFGYVMLRAFYI